MGGTCIVIIASLSFILFLRIYTNSSSYGLAFCTIILLQFNIYLKIDISVYNSILFIYFVLIFIHVIVHTYRKESSSQNILEKCFFFD